MLFECPQYEKERLQLNQVEKEPIKSINDFKNALTCISRTREIASFLKKCHNIRFPEDDIAAKKKSMENFHICRLIKVLYKLTMFMYCPIRSVSAS